VRFSYVVPTTVWWGVACAAIGLLLAVFAAPALQRAIGSVK
jgi:hypothetical protein